MNYPRIIFYATPIKSTQDLKFEKNVFGCVRGIYNPPAWQEETIALLEGEGYTVTVNALNDCPRGELKTIHGLVFADGCLYTIREYMKRSYGRIYTLIWYQFPLSEGELLMVKRHFSQFFGLFSGRNIATRRHRLLKERGVFSPIPILKPIGGNFNE